MTGVFAVFPHDETGYLDTPRFEVPGIDAVVANEGVGQHHDLPSVGRVRERFLVARHAGVEYDLAVAVGFGSEGLTPVN